MSESMQRKKQLGRDSKLPDKLVLWESREGSVMWQTGSEHPFSSYHSKPTRRLLGSFPLLDAQVYMNLGPRQQAQMKKNTPNQNNHSPNPYTLEQLEAGKSLGACGLVWNEMT